MLLNSVALAFVMEADAVLFKAARRVSDTHAFKNIMGNQEKNWIADAVPDSVAFNLHALYDKQPFLMRLLLWGFSCLERGLRRR